MNSMVSCAKCKYYDPGRSDEWPVPPHCIAPVPVWVDKIVTITREAAIVSKEMGVRCKAYTPKVAMRSLQGE